MFWPAVRAMEVSPLMVLLLVIEPVVAVMVMDLLELLIEVAVAVDHKAHLIMVVLVDQV